MERKVKRRAMPIRVHTRRPFTPELSTSINHSLMLLLFSLDMCRSILDRGKKSLTSDIFISEHITANNWKNWSSILFVWQFDMWFFFVLLLGLGLHPVLCKHNFWLRVWGLLPWSSGDHTVPGIEPLLSAFKAHYPFLPSPDSFNIDGVRKVIWGI